MALYCCPAFVGRYVRSCEILCGYAPAKNTHFRLSSSSNQHSPLPQPEIKPPGKLKAFIVKKYVNYLEKFDSTFGQKYPKIYKIYRLFKDGIRDFYADTRLYYRVATDIWSGRPLSTFTRKELQTYQQLPGDMIRSAPVLISVPLPLAPYVVFPLAYLFPRQLLCRHFWTLQQRLEFAHHDLMHRLVHYSKILSYLETHAASIRDTSKRNIFTDILYQIANDIHPDVESILEVKDVFTTYPFGMEHLIKRHKIHLWHLCRSLDVSTIRSKFLPAITFLHHIDQAIAREGIEQISLPDLQELCFARGLNAINVEEEDLRTYLRNWIRVSTSVDRSSYSLLLHCPVLLSSTWPSNSKHLAFLRTW